MSRTSSTPIWPFVLVVIFLFLLSITGPRGWEKVARREPLGNLAAKRERHALPFAQRSSVYARLAEDRTPPRGDRRHREPAAESAEVPAEVSVGQSAAKQAEPAPATTTEPETDVVQAPGLDPPASEPVTSAATEAPAETPIEAAAEPVAVEVANRPQRPELDLESPAVESAEPVVVTDSAPRWAPPVDLIRRLDALRCECECSDWAHAVGALVDELSSRQLPSDQRVAVILDELRRLSSSVDALVPAIRQRAVCIDLLRARHALSRRLDVWEMVPTLSRLGDAPPAPTKDKLDHLTASLSSVEAVTRLGGAEGQRWQKYLLLDALGEIGRRAQERDANDARRVAREVLNRLERGDLTSWQRQFLSEGPVARLAEALRPWAAEPVEPWGLLADIERFEQSELQSDARRLAAEYRQLSWLPGSAGQQPLAHRLETHYRNANVRVVVTEQLLKRLMPDMQLTTDPVSDRILGAPTRGSSTTSTFVDVKLVPDERRLRLALEASGQIFANTRSTKGPATLYSRSDSLYYARTLLDVEPTGIKAWPAECDCLGSSTRLRSVSTDFDGVPLVGALMEGFARSAHSGKEEQLRQVMRHKVESQARAKMDAVTREKVAAANQQLRERVLRPLNRLAMAPYVIGAETSEQRLTLRLRLAADEQLAGYTPRPRAPADSLASLQLHQSVINNVCEQLHLDGRTFTMPQLALHISDLLNLAEFKLGDEAAQELSITFADEDAVQVRCDAGQIELNLAVARLANDEQSWRNFRVRVYYKPEVDGLHVRLVRDGVVQLIGDRLSVKSQVALRGIFSKTFSKDRAVQLVDPRWTTDPRTRDLLVSQFSLQDGWLAIAVSEQASPAGVVRRPGEKLR